MEHALDAPRDGVVGDVTAEIGAQLRRRVPASCPSSLRTRRGLTCGSVRIHFTRTLSALLRGS